MFGKFDKKKFLLMLIGVTGMGVFLSFMVGANYGTDTSTFMNTAVAKALGLSFGTTMVVTNAIWFIPQVIFKRELIGLGTIANMTLIGYVCDFCRMLETKYLPAGTFVEQPSRTLMFLVGLIPFLFFTTMYMVSDQGLAPFDSVPLIVSEKLHLPFFAVRIGWDALMIIIGLVLGKRLTIGTLVLALTLGPAITVFGRWMRNAFGIKEA